MQRILSFSLIYWRIWLWGWAGKSPCLMLWDLGYCLGPVLTGMRGDYIFVSNRPLWISSRGICVICDSRWARLPNTKELGFSSVVTVLVGKLHSLLTRPLFDYSQWLHNILRSDIFWEVVVGGGSWSRHVVLEASSQNPDTQGIQQGSCLACFPPARPMFKLPKEDTGSPSVFKN